MPSDLRPSPESTSTLRRGISRPTERGARGWAVAVVFVSLPASVQAHTAIQGMGEIGSGLLHPLLTPPHLLLLTALGFLLGQQRPFRSGLPAAGFAVGAASGLLVTTTGFVPARLTSGLMLLILLTSGMIALARPLPRGLLLALCAASALALGLDSGVEAGVSAVAAAKTLTATAISLVLCVVNIAFYVSLLPSLPWARVGVRIVGSWIAAVALLMLAFALRHA